MRLIDADALPKLLDAEYKQTMKLIWEGEKHLDTLAEGFTEATHIAKYIAPIVDAVPVVRCKDCLYWNSAIGFCHQNSQYYNGGESWDIYQPDDFCSRGERRG